MHRIGYLLTEGFQVMALGTQTVFEFANVVAREPVYCVTNYSIAGGDRRASVGAAVATLPAELDAADSWMVSGIVDPTDRPTHPDEVTFLKDVSSRARRLVGMCTGAFALGDAGLLDNRRVTTHWAFADALKSRCPLAKVDMDRIFVVDGTIWTSAGLTAAMDLALGMVEKDLGPEIASRVAHVLVMHHRRSGGQSQHSEMLKLAPKSDKVQTALEFVRKNLAKPLRIADMAHAANLSTRQFQRVFQSETGESPSRAVERIRLETARNLVERGRHSLEVIARETGFRDRRHLREVFQRTFGAAPRTLRRDAREGDAD
ncbi:GlxA family transcriptional regulator [Cupriavidus plantarum]|uniref:GlxA family transcriptional regulator n=1 Tax=Cupriavidus plantarum TaxID=942865 RepID=UPI00339D721F